MQIIAPSDYFACETRHQTLTVFLSPTHVYLFGHNDFDVGLAIIDYGSAKSLADYIKKPTDGRWSRCSPESFFLEVYPETKGEPYAEGFSVKLGKGPRIFVDKDDAQGLADYLRRRLHVKP